jgi:hemolysin-activating ACP:hemolysin acyltransferase
VFFSKKSKAAAAVGAGAAQAVVQIAEAAPVGATSQALAEAGAAALAAIQPPPPPGATLHAVASQSVPGAPAQNQAVPLGVLTGASEAPSAKGPTPEQLKAKLDLARAAITSYGSIVSVMARSRPYQSMPLSELRYLAVPAMATGQFIAASGLIDQKRPDGPFGPIAVVIWAYVSPEIDQKLLADPNAPFRLFIPDYKSGDIPWIIEAAGRKPVVDKLLAQLLEKEFKGQPVKVRMRAPDGKVTAGVYNSQQAAV